MIDHPLCYGFRLMVVKSFQYKGTLMKIYRAYIKQIAENKNHSPVKQRQMIFDCLKEKYKLRDNQIIEKLTDCKNLSLINDIKNPKAVLYWYIDSDSRENLELLLYEHQETDQVITADYTIPPIDINYLQINEGKHIQASMFRTIMELHNQKMSLRKIKNELQDRLGLSIGYVTVKNIIDRQQKGIRIQNILSNSQSLQ
jgi:hypothetical protein